MAELDNTDEFYQRQYGHVVDIGIHNYFSVFRLREEKVSGGDEFDFEFVVFDEEGLSNECYLEVIMQGE